MLRLCLHKSRVCACVHVGCLHMFIGVWCMCSVHARRGVCTSMQVGVACVCLVCIGVHACVHDVQWCMHAYEGVVCACGHVGGCMHV